MNARVACELLMPNSETYDTSQDEALFRHRHAQAAQACCRHLRYSSNELVEPMKTCRNITHLS